MADKNYFEQVYSTHQQNTQNIPWATHAPNDFLVDYLNRETIESGKKALVIGCGLGDDAVHLAEAGYHVDAIDISPTAIQIAQERYAQSGVNFFVADIFHMPRDFGEHYDFIYEGLTIQSLPRALRQELIETIIALLNPNGAILIYANVQEDHHNFGGPPWPLYRHELALFEKHGLIKSYELSQAEPKPVAPYRHGVLYRFVR